MFRSHSIELTNTLPRSIAKEYGIFFTPKTIRTQCINWLKERGIYSQTIFRTSNGLWGIHIRS